jgi:hypothetical protein
VAAPRVRVAGAAGYEVEAKVAAAELEWVLIAGFRTGVRTKAAEKLHCIFKLQFRWQLVGPSEHTWANAFL